jgi:O-acetyl-ADP-ribose deacetylase (regulator of RNase III)
LFDGAELLPPGLLFSEVSDVAVTMDGLACVRHLKVRDSTAILTIAEDSVVKCTTGAIVNAANEGCLGGGGIDGVICRLGGDALAAARQALPILTGEQDGLRCHTGDAKLTIAGELPCEFVIHAVGPNFHCYPDQKEAMALLASAYKSAMERAREQGVKKVAFCMLSAGIFRGSCPLRDIVEVGLMTVAQHVYPGLQRVYLCAFSDEEKDQLRHICSAMKQADAPGYPASGAEGEGEGSLVSRPIHVQGSIPWTLRKSRQASQEGASAEGPRRT